jgi:DNA polymerase III alpha subunit
MTEGAKKIFGAEALKPEQVLDQPNNKAVVVGGAVESIIFFPIKTGKNKGKEMAKIVLTNEGNKCEIVVFPKTIESSDKGTGKIRKIKEFTPLIVKGKVNHWNGNVSVIFDECWILI